MKSIITKILGLYLHAMARISPAYAAKHGLLLFCRPFRQAITRKQMAFFKSAVRFRIRHEEYDIQGYSWGNGPKKILLIHGWQSHTYRWKPYVESLPHHEYTIYSIDAPGHGLSSGSFLSVPLYSALIERFIKDRGEVHTVIGHSLGGFSLLHTLYNNPELKINRLILLAPPGEASEFIRVFQETLGLSDYAVGLVISAFEKRYQVTPDYFSASRFARQVTAAGLIIHDEEDNEAPFHHSVRLQKVWAGSRLLPTKGYGHNLKSAAVVREVVDFIKEADRETVVL